MSIAIGIDLVDIERFAHFYTYPYRRLRRIFSDEEIRYCLSIPTKSAERFASRFACKEALFKAISSHEGKIPCNPLTFFKLASLKKNGAPEPIIDWGRLNMASRNVCLSITHTKNSACAVALIVFDEK